MPRQRRGTAVAQTRRGLLRALLGLPLWLSGMAVTAQTLWTEDLQRLRVGLKLFPAALGALEGLDQRRSEDGGLPVVVLYSGSRDAARQAVSALEDVEPVQGMPLEVSALSLQEIEHYEGPRISAIFIASVGLQPAQLRGLSERHRTLVYSPFAGDVRGGAIAGVHVADRILPAVNLTQARRVGLSFKSFFLRVAHHEE
ncbi:MAG: hypothetical protein EOM91_04280 [Sphingobacteriia bacterium]|nr:hypothetical protein [Sphingobacteriia bacterium]NCC39619.1 hypothetical protein [Gammaproteobacteria bacterium]